MAAPVLAVRVPTNPEPDIACPADAGTGWLTNYATTVETPADSTDWYVTVEFTLAGGEGAADCELSLATYELGGPTFSYPQTLFDSDTGVFGNGTHTLTAALPREGDAAGCWAQYDFVFGPAIEELTFDNRYDGRQIRARIVGADDCSIAEATPTPTPTPKPSEGTEGGNPTPTPTPTPREGTEGGNPTPTPAGELPNTSMFESQGTAGTPAQGLALVVVAGLVLLAARRLQVARARC